MNNKIVMSGLSIMTALTLMAGSAYAAFVSTATSSGNTFSVGNANLQIGTDAIPFTNNIPGFTGINMAPGVPMVYTFYLKNSSVSAITLDTVVKLDTAVGEVLKDIVTVKFSCTNGGGSGITTTTGTYTVNQWVAGQDSLGSLTQNDTATCTMTVELPSSAGSGVAGANLIFNGQFNATQAP